MKSCITCNNYSNNYKYIILSFIFYIYNNIIFGTNYNESFRQLKIPPGELVKNNKYIYQTFCYFGTFLISLLFFKIEERQLKSQSVNYSAPMSDPPKKKRHK